MNSLEMAGLVKPIVHLGQRFSWDWGTRMSLGLPLHDLKAAKPTRAVMRSVNEIVGEVIKALTERTL